MTNESKIISIFPLVLTASLYFLLEYVDYVVHFPKGNDLFYKGSLILVLMFSFINLWCLVKETKGILKRRSDEQTLYLKFMELISIASGGWMTKHSVVNVIWNNLSWLSHFKSLFPLFLRNIINRLMIIILRLDN